MKTKREFNNSERIKLTEKLGYGAGDASSNFFYYTFNIFLLSYYVDVFGLTAGAVGTMFLVTKLFDALTDVGMGLVADRTHSRWGRYRPYILWGAVPFGVIGFLMFANPGFSQSGKLVYAYITYSLMMIVYTIINIPYSALLGVISPHSSERESLSTYRFAFAFGAQLLLSVSVLPLKDYLGRGDEARGYQLTMAIFAAISITLWLITFVTTKERVEPVSSAKTKLREDFSSIFRNGPWLVLMVVAFFNLASVAIRGGATVFFMKYYVGAGSADISLFFLTGLGALVLGSMTTRFWTRYFEKRTLLFVLPVINGIAIIALFFVPRESFVLLLALNAFANIITGPTPALVWAMYSDCVVYSEWKFNRINSGLVFSGAMFCHKTALAIGAGFSGWILAFIGFVANAEQTSESLNGIRLMFSVIPGIFILISAVAVIFYPLRDAFVDEMEENLASRRDEIL